MASVAILVGLSANPFGLAEAGRAASERRVEEWPATHRARRAWLASGQDSEPKQADHSSQHHETDAGDQERNHQVHLLELPADLRCERAIDVLQLARGLRVVVLSTGR